MLDRNLKLWITFSYLIWYKFLFWTGNFFNFRIPPDYVLERSLALNYSFHAYLASSTAIPSYMYGTNNTKIIRTTVVANDPADFSRNSYGQRTVNDLLLTHGHSHITLLRLLSTAQTVEMWQLLRFLIRDNVLSNLDQLHLVVYIGALLIHPLKTVTAS